jgi:type I restriction enzyme S subunit
MKEGWEIKSLDDVCKLITCGVAARPNYVDSGVPFLSAKNVKNGKIIWSDFKYITKETHQELTKHNKPQKGDLLYTRVGSYGEAAIIDLEIEFSVFVSLTLIKPKSQVIHNEYLKNYLNSDTVKQIAKSSISGSGVGNLNVGTVRKFTIPFPPLPEQQRIVTIIDKAFEAIDKAIENTQKNLQNAKELFESYLNSVFENGGEGWERKEMGDIASVQYGYTDKSFDKGQFRYIRITDISPDGRLIAEDKKYLSSVNKLDLQDYILEHHDLLMARTGATFAKVLLYENLEPSVFASYLIKIKFNVHIENELYWYFTKTKMYWLQAHHLSSGSAQPQFNGAALKQLKVSYPIDIVKQKELIEEFKELLLKVTVLESQYQQKLANLEELKKSILNKAFAGEL